MPTSLLPEPDFSSPLARDVALSRVRLAAVKSASNGHLSKEEKRSVLLLRDILREELEQLSATDEIPEDLVPREEMRHQLEEMLGTLPHPRTSDSGGADAASLTALLQLLDRLLAAGKLTQRNAQRLLRLLLDFEKCEQAPSLPEGLLALNGRTA